MVIVFLGVGRKRCVWFLVIADGVDVFVEFLVFYVVFFRSLVFVEFFVVCRVCGCV